MCTSLKKGDPGLKSHSPVRKRPDGRQMLMLSARTKSRAVDCMDQGGRLDAAVLEHEIHWLKSDESALRCLVFENMEPFCVGPWDCIFDLGASFMMLPQLRQLRFHAESTSRGSSAWSTALAPGRCSIDRITFRSARAACADFPQTGSTYVGKASVLRLALLS
jgi:hypothetical protein